MRLLELFSGTGSVRKAMEHQYDEIISIDILSKFNPTEVVDILEWDYKKYPVGYFDSIWASPPCIEYSILKQNTGLPTNLELADRIVLRTLEIISYFEPDRWFIENPQTSILKKREFMRDIPYYDYDYCCFSNWGYRKRTRIWTNTDKESILCRGEGNCSNMTGRFHRVSFGGQGRPKDHIYETCPAGETAYRIPERLIHYLFQ